MISIKRQLALSASTLLSTAPATSVGIEIDNAWDIDNALLYYSEADDRVDVVKYVADVGGNVSGRDRIRLKAVLDTMSGATPTGAVKLSTPTFTGASGGSSGGSVESNASALAKFDDTRTGLSLDWIRSYDSGIELDYNGAVSVENDYRSYSAAVTVNIDTEGKTSKYTAGIAGTFDQVFRVGGNDTPAGLTAIEDGIFFGEGEKSTIDIILGYSRVINRRTIGQINLGISRSEGYLNDPYKVFSIVDINTGSVGKSYFEQRPDTRLRYTLGFQVNHQLYPNNDIIRAAYRYYTDDWEVDSHTVDFSYHLKFTPKTYIEPRLRFYSQTAAFFYMNQFFAEIENNPQFEDIPDTFPQYISADYRLDQMTSTTAGFILGTTIGTDGLLRGRIEYIAQSFDASEFDENNAIVAQISYNVQF